MRWLRVNAQTTLLGSQQGALSMTQIIISHFCSMQPNYRQPNDQAVKASGRSAVSVGLDLACGLRVSRGFPHYYVTLERVHLVC
jgi:hypothetical protein